MPENVTAEEADPLQTATFDGEVIPGVGFTVTVKVCAAPVQEAVDGVTVKMPLTLVAPELLVVNDPILPDPDTPMPIVPLLFVQE